MKHLNTPLNKIRPKSSNYRQVLTEYNAYDNNRYKNFNMNSQDFPYLKDKIIKSKKYFIKKNKTQKNPEFSHRNFFLSAKPFNYFKGKSNKNEFLACYNGGPKIKINNPKKINFNINEIPKLRSSSYFPQYNPRLFRKPCGCIISNRYFNNDNLKLKNDDNNGNNKKLRLVTDLNINDYDYDFNDKNFIREIDKVENNKNTEIYEKKIEQKNDKNELNFFKKKPKKRFHKIQIHNLCKPYLVEHYRFYAEKYL